MVHREKSLYLIQNLDIALKILFMVEESPRTLKELAQSLNLREDRVRRIVRTLVNREWLSLDQESGKIIPGVKNFELGRAYFEHLDVRSLAKPLLKSVSDSIGENTYLVSRVGYEVLYIEKNEVDRAVGVASRFGKALPLYVSAAGKVFLSYMSKEEVEEFIKTTRWFKYTDRTKKPDELRGDLKGIRDSGYAVSLGEYEEDVGSVAAPVFDYGGKVNYAVSVVFPLFRVSSSLLETKFKEVLLKASEELSKKLGKL